MIKSVFLSVSLFFIFLATGSAQCLSGTYTIGGTSPSYATITAAVAALNTNGVCGPVVFNIRSGTYSEQVTIPAIAGSSATNTITFQSEALDSTAVIVRAAGTSTNNFVVKLNGADYIRFYKLKFKNTAITYSSLLTVAGSSDNNSIKSCYLESPITSTAATTKYLVNFTSSDNENWLISNNYFSGGARAIQNTGSVAVINDFRITGNFFSNNCETGIFLNSVHSPVIRNNKFVDSIAVSSYAIHTASCNDSTIISGNNIMLLAGGTGMNIASCTGSTARSFLVSNNVINGGGNLNGILLSGSSRIFIAHNTVISSGSAGMYCFTAFTSNTTDTLKNNIFYQKGLGAIYSSPNPFVADYNDAYCAGTIFGTYGSFTCYDMAGWKSSTLQDLNSVSAIPQFMSSSDCHISSDFSQNLVLPYFSKISKDIDGVNRDVSSPYFGAYEFFNVPIPVDVSLENFVAPVVSECAGVKSVKVKIRNRGVNTLTSVMISWQVNGVSQTPFSWSGTLGFYDTATVTLGNLAYASLGTYNLKSWTSNPNGTADVWNMNDTARTPTLYTKMNGTYTVGGSAPDFATMAAAQSALATRGICGNVTLNLRSGIYSEGMTLSSFAGLSGSNSLTIQSESGINTSVTVNNPSGWGFILAGTTNVTIRNLTITGPSFGCIYLSGSSTNTEISNCIFNAPSTTGSAAIDATVSSGGHNRTRILNNTINSGYYCMHFDGSPGRYKNLRIENNTMNTPTGGQVSITAADTLNYTGNVILQANAQSTATAFSSLTYSTIKNNRFYSQNYTALSLTSVNTSIVANNMIVFKGTLLNPACNAVSCQGLKFINNSVSNSNSAGTSTALNITSTPAAYNSLFMNNSIANSGTGPAIVVGTSSAPALKKNAYYSAGNVFGTYGTATATTFSGWPSIAASDSASFYANPYYTSALDPHAHNSLLKDAGMSVSAWITDDYDGQLRDATPDIGADEFALVPVDAGLEGFNFGSSLCAGINPVKIILKNNGSSVLTSATLNYKINSMLQTPYTWTGTLAPGTQAIVTPGTYNFLPFTAYSFNAWSSNPNGTTDGMLLNDTIARTYTGTALNGAYTIGGSSPDFTTIVNAAQALATGGICGPVIFNIRPGTYTEQVRMGEIRGVSAVNTVRFQSENLDSSAVTIQYNATASTANYTVNVDSADYVSFYKLSFKSLSTSFSGILLFSNKAIHGEIRNCVLTAPAGGNGNLASFPALSDSCLVMNSKFYSSSTALNLAANYGRIANNYFEGQTSAGVNIASIGFQCTSNTINYLLNSAVAINVSGSTTEGIISKNKISIGSVGGAMSLAGSSLSAGVSVINNTISLNGGGGITLVGVSNGKIIHNSVSQRGTGACFAVYSSSNIISRNNIFYKNLSSSYCVVLGAGNTAYSSNYNCIYNPYGTLVNNNSVFYTSLAAYTTATGNEAASVSGDPGFYSYTDLHVNTPLLNGAALYDPAVTDDMDGDLRNAVTPDIGADEFTPFVLSTDVRIMNLYVGNSTCGGTKLLYAKIKNVGTDTLRTLQLAAAYHGITYAPVSWAGTLPYDATQDSIVVATLSGAYGNGAIKAWTFLPNAIADANQLNDTLSITPAMALSGVYKIGGTLPDFTTLRQAATALKAYGICSNVSFEIRPGTYTDTLSFSVINGTTIYTIKFRAENGDSSSVILQDYAVSAATTNYILQLNSQRNITFEKLTFKQNLATSPSGGNYGILIRNGSAAPGINISILNCRYIASASSAKSVEVSAASGIANFQLKNNFFSGPGYGFRVQSSTGTSMNIVNNVFQDCQVSAMDLATFSGATVTISDNKILSSQTDAAQAGLLLNQITCTVERNTFIMKTGTAIYSYAGQNIIRNNYIQVDSVYSTSYLAVVKLMGASNLSQFVFNTLKTKGYRSGDYMLYLNSSTNFPVKNNIIINTGTLGGLIYSTSNNQIDYNRYQTNNTALFGYCTGPVATFALWKINAHADAHSQNQATYLRALPGYEVNGDYDLNNAGTPVAGAGTDIVNTLRNSLTPDIGAYEFTPTGVDAGMKRIIMTDTLLCAGANPVTVVVRNFGGVTLTAIDIHWKVNNTAQPVYSFTGSIAAGDSAIIALGPYTFNGRGLYSFEFYTAQPNGVPDVFNMSDTLRTRVYKTRLNGVYTIGGSSPDFLTFKNAADTVQAYGICGPVTFNMRNGTYVSNFTMGTIPGSSATNTVTFQSQSLDSSLVSIADNGQSLTLSNTKNIRFNKLSFVQNSTLNYSTISIYGSAKNITISNCSFSKPNTVSATIYSTFGDTLSGGLTVRNCLFGMNTNIGLGGSSSTLKARNILITNNVFISAIQVGMTNLDDIEFSGNTMSANLSITNAGRAVKISRNKIVTGNMTLTTGASASSSDITNNIIDNGSMNITTSSALNIYHNTVVLNSVSTSAPGLYLSGSVANVKVRNNIFVNRSGINVYTINDPVLNSTVMANLFDHNVVYTPGDTLVFSYATPNYITKAQWQSSYHQDQSSVFSEPQFTGVHDFHPLDDIHINNIGMPAPLVPVDYDGQARSLVSPDPGAYEFNLIPVANDAGIQNYSAGFCEGSSNPVNVVLKNYGSNPLTAVTIYWFVDAMLQPAYNWSGTLAPDSSVSVVLGAYVPSLSSTNNFLFYTQQPNGTTDGRTTNDTLVAPGLPSTLSGTYTVGGSSADFSSLGDATAALFQYGICSPVEFVFNPGTYLNSTGNLALTNIIGNNAVNTITFRSQTGNASTVTVYFGNSSSSSTYGSLILSNITGVTFKNLSFEGGVVIGANTKNVLFTGNRFNVSGLYNPNGLISSSAYHENVSYINNYFKNSAIVFNYTHSYTATMPKKIIIKGNTFDGAYDGLEMSRVDTLIADSNLFYRTGPVVSNSHAIRILTPHGYYEISRNIIDGNFERGIEIGIGSSVSASRISNNVIIASASSMLYGIITYCDSTNIYYNSIRMMGARAPLTINNPGSKVLNNILTSQTGPLIAYTSSLYLSYRSDYNILYTNGANLFVRSSTGYPGLAAYTTATGLEAHSSVHDPQFASSSDLHYLNDTLDGKAIPLATITIDQQGHARDLIAPNPGAYETSADTVYDAINKYLVLRSIANDTLMIGNNAISANILYGAPPLVNTNVYHYTGTIDSLRIHYSVNDLPEVTETWHGALSFGDSLTYTFTTLHTVPNGKLYDIKVWFENLNPLQSEINLADDSLHKIIYMPMLGDYTIGGITPDFTSYIKTYFSIVNCGTLGDVRFLYRPGHYDTDYDTEVIRYEGQSWHAVSGWIEYSSETGNADDVFIKLQWLNDAGKLKFSNLTITPLTSNSTSFTDDGVEISSVGETAFDHCKFRGGSIIAEQNGLAFWKQYGAPASTITNCTFTNLRYAIHLTGINSYTSSAATNFTFENNIIDSCDRGILIRDFTVDSYNKKLIIKKNKITTAGNAIEVTINGGQNLQLSYNDIHAGGAGLDFTVPTNHTVITNNMIHSAVTNRIFDAKCLTAYNNTFNERTWIRTPTDSIGLYNNVFYSAGSNGALVLTHGATGLMINSDNNDYYAPNSSYLFKDELNVSPFTTYDFVTAQQIRNTVSRDSSSINVDPLFLSASDLHSQSANLKGLAKPFSFITTDIDGESRLLDAPDIGADEINLIVTDVWPGDADKNNMVDNNDLLPIGLFYGQNGSPRSFISNAWTGYASMDWGTGQLSGYDIKHIDCNGDGSIDDNDTLAVNFNFSSTHMLAPLPVTDQARLLVPPMYWTTTSTSYTAGDWVTADLYIGSSSVPVPALYGIAFNAGYSSSLVQPGTETLSYPVSWLGTPGTDAIKMNKIDNGSGIAYGAEVRTDHINATGYGKIATLKFQLKNTISSTTTLSLNTLSYYAVDVNGDTVFFTPLPGSVTVYPLSTAVYENENTTTINIYPNPYIGSTTILYALERSSGVNIEIYDAMGRKVQKLTDGIQSAGEYSTTFSAKALGLDAGVYFVRITIDGKTQMRRIIEMK